jgi:hypothetical protein
MEALFFIPGIRYKMLEEYFVCLQIFLIGLKYLQIQSLSLINLVNK